MIGKQVSFTGKPFDSNNAFALRGNLYDIGTRVIRWTDPTGFNGYEKKRAVVEVENRKTGRVTRKVIKGARYSKRAVVGDGLNKISQFFIHHTGGPLAERAFETLHNNRKLSVPFILSDVGVTYQTLDAIEKAWQAGKHNPISVGVECCLYPSADRNPDYYSEARCKRLGMAPHEVMEDRIHGRKWEVFKFTDAQVEALARLAAGMWLALKLEGDTKIPDEPPRFFRDESGEIPRTVIANPLKWTGMIGHLQATRRKVDPAGFPWEEFEARVAEIFYSFRAKVRG